MFRRFFDAIVEQCQQEKLVWGKELYVDNTQVNANADLDSLAPCFAVEAVCASFWRLFGYYTRTYLEKDLFFCRIVQLIQ